MFSRFDMRRVILVVLYYSLSSAHAAFLPMGPPWCTLLERRPRHQDQLRGSLHIVLPHSLPLLDPAASSLLGERYTMWMEGKVWGKVWSLIKQVMARIVEREHTNVLHYTCPFLLSKRRSLISKAMMHPALCMREARCPVLLPGAAHASMQWALSFTSTHRAEKQLDYKEE